MALNKIGALWCKQTSKGDDMMSGIIGGKSVLVFQVKKRNPKAPDWEVFDPGAKDELPDNKEHGNDDVPF